MLYQMNRLLRLTAAAGYPLTTAPLICIPLFYDQRIPPPLSVGVWGVTALFMLLLVCSAVIEPARFARRHPGRAGTTGTYSISRHPGWLWFTAVHLLYTVLFPYSQVMVLLGFSTAANFAVIWIQDRYLFPKLFENYRTYQKHVRFLL